MMSITEGQVFIMKSGTNSWAMVEVGMALEIGDIMKTSDTSGALITFFEGSTIELEAGTEVSVVEVDIATDAGSTTIRLDQAIGRTISQVLKLIDPVSVCNHLHRILVSTLNPLWCLTNLW